MKTLLNIKELAGLIDQYCGNTPVAVRSSAPGEDSASNSFAGLHDSFLNVSGTSEIIKHIKLVWASLYSDAALLYRKELGLDIQTSRKVSPDKTAIEKWISSRQIVGHPAGPNRRYAHSWGDYCQGIRIAVHHGCFKCHEVDRKWESDNR